MFPNEISNLPGQIEAALQFLRFTEAIQHPHSFDSMSRQGRDLTRTELEVMDSALTVLLEYFNHPVAWSDTDPSTPTHYDATGPSGKIHRMVPAERISLHSNALRAALSSHLAVVIDPLEIARQRMLADPPATMEMARRFLPQAVDPLSQKCHERSPIMNGVRPRGLTFPALTPRVAGLRG